jgi:multidrug transporter EmrE-like cation transporter
LNRQVIYTLYALCSAACYVGATGVMKYYTQLGLAKAAPPITLFLIGAVCFETAALKSERLAMILLLILGFECALGLLFSWLWLRESYTIRELAGLVLIMVGVGLTKL